MNIDLNELLRRVVVVFRRPVILGSTAGGILVVIIWLIAFFLPQGHTLSTLALQEQTLTKKVVTAKAQIVALKKLNHTAPVFTARIKRIHLYVPTVAEETTLLNAIQAQVKASGSSYVSMAPAAPSVYVPGGAAATKAKAKPTGITQIPVSLIVSATYDQALSLITHIYDMTRLVTITGVQIHGGGLTVARTALLTVSLTLKAFFVTQTIANAKPVVTPTLAKEKATKATASK